METCRSASASAPHRLLERLMAGCAAKESTLLVVGSGWDLDPAWLWRRGFDVTVIDRTPGISRMEGSGSPKITYRQGAPDAMPFENGSFDYIVLNHQLFPSGEEGAGQDILPEALRIASRSILVLEWNRLFADGLQKAVAGDAAAAGCRRNALSCAWPWEMLALFKQCCPERKTSWLSTMLLGSRSRQGMQGRRLFPVENACLSLPVGALIGVRIDWQSATGSGLSLLDRVRERLRISAGESGEVMGSGMRCALQGLPSASPPAERPHRQRAVRAPVPHRG